MASTISRPTITDDNGTGTTGTIQDATFWGDILDRVDAMFAGAGAYATFSFGGKVNVMSSLAAGPADQISLSGLGSSDLYYVAANYINANGTESVTASGRASWRAYMRVATDLAIGWDFRAASAAVTTWTNLMKLTSTGVLQIASHLNLLNTSAALFWASSSGIDVSRGDGTLRFSNNAGTAGVVARFTTDARLEIRNQANSAFADIYGKDLHCASGFFTAGVDISGGIVAGGSVGISRTFDPSTSSSVTYVDGILTAQS